MHYCIKQNVSIEIFLLDHSIPLGNGFICRYCGGEWAYSGVTWFKQHLDHWQVNATACLAILTRLGDKAHNLLPVKAMRRVDSSSITTTNSSTSTRRGYAYIQTPRSPPVQKRALQTSLRSRWNGVLLPNQQDQIQRRLRCLSQLDSLI